eukprot:TRINITY_DN609_c1_g1_i3.p1 TRINITY_DN609_c1_g1~~TRINITY_DN609_c1_g1_i3.p1  ORF type:complete len:1094 (-),score=260.20 TRINITY_DN609_c1_g1_i3:128-3409(-)
MGRDVYGRASHHHCNERSRQDSKGRTHKGQRLLQRLLPGLHHSLIFHYYFHHSLIFTLFQVVLHPTQPGMFTLHLNYRTKYECQTDSHITRDIIVLTLNSFFSLAVTLKKPSNKQPESRPLKDEGKGVQSVSEQQRDRIVPLEQIRAEASHKPHQQELTAMTDDSPRIVNIEITGGPFHTSPLQVHAEYRGGIEGASIIQWYRSQQNWFFTAIPNANQPIFQPTAEDVNTRIRVEYTPVRSDGVRGPTVVAMVPESFLVIDPRLTRAVEQNVMRGSATFELTVKNQPKEKRTLLLTHQGVEILKGDKLIVKARYQRIKTAVSVEDYTGFDLTFNSKIKYSFVVRDTIERDLIIFTIHTLGSLNAIAKKNMALASSMGFRTKEDGEVNVSKDGDKEVWGEWGKWTSYNKGHGAGPGQSTKGVDLEISEAFDDGEEDISGIIGWGASRDPGYGRGGGGGGSGGGVRGRGRGTMRGGGSVGGYGRGGVGRGGPGGPGDVVRGGLSTKDELAQLQGRGRGKEGAGATAGSTGPSGPRPGAGGAREPPKNPLFASRKTGGGKGGNPYSGAKLKEQMLNQPVFEAPVAGPDGIPPPPPPPPPGGDGGPPPPPPPPPGEEALPEREQKTKQLHWEKISRAALDKSVWRNATDAGVEIDDDLLAEMFKMEDAKALAAGRGGREEGGGEVQLRNRHQINIVIEGIKKPPEAIFEATLACRDSELDSAAWVQLNTFARKEEEDSKENILRLSSFSGDMSSLGRAEQLFAMLLRIPRLTSRFDAILFKLNLDLALPELHNKITVVTSACSQILNNAKFTRILEIILAFGNYLNFGTQRGFALGFRLDALRKLGDTRAVDKKTTLLHFLANFVAEREEELLLFGQEMPDVEKAAAISFLTLNADLDVLVRGLQNIEEEIAFLKENSSIAGDQFVSVMSQFLKHATNQIGELMKEATGMKEKTEKLAKYFAEDLSTFDPEGVFDILSSFIRDFQKAHKENLSAREKIMKAQEAQERALAGPSSSSSTASNRGGGAEAGLSSVKLKPVAPKPAAGATPMDFVLGVASSFSREAGDAEDGDDYYDDYDDDDIDDDDGLYLPDDAQARA